VEGALDVNCVKNGIVAFMAEVGSGGRLEEENIDIACVGIENVMKHMKMIPGEPKVSEEQITLTWRKFIRCSEAGLVFMKVKPYEFAAKGTLLAEVVDLFGNIVEEIRAPRDCYVICRRFDPVAHTGDRIAFIGSC
jgi:predicted deacylase